MRAYCGQTREKGLIKTLRDAGIGECTVRGELKSRKRSLWFYDNGAYRDWTAGVPFNGVRFAGDCRRMRMDQEVGAATPDFVVIPDLVAAGAASLAFSSTWYHDVEGLPCYVAVQDGMTETDVAAWIDEWDARDDADVPAEVQPLAGIFVGGTLEWKLATGAAWVAFAHARGLRCHVGRVGTAERVRWARSIGADSIDSCLPLMYREHLEAFLGALAEPDPTPAVDPSPEPDADERPSDHVQPERQEQDMKTTTAARNPILRVHLDPDEMVVDNFAGGGGASSGIEWAIHRSPDIAINHDAEAIQLHSANHPNTKHYIEDIWQVDPAEAVGKRRVGLLWASPDCFPAGTLVLTARGYEPIESIQVGDEVLTHRGRWRRVTETSTARRPLMSLRGHGHPGLLVSPEHPFYARPSKHGAADWLPASALDAGCYWATPVAFPASDVPVVGGRGMAITTDLLWLAGRYVADGWTRITDTRAELVISCGRHEVAALRDRLASWPRAGQRAEHNELAWSERDIPSTEDTGSYQFSTNHRGLVEWLREWFGHGAEHKHFPSWALGMDESLRAALLAGYVSGDGWRGKPARSTALVQVSTVSKALAFSAKALAASLGHTVTVYVGENSNVIEGRAVNAKPCWRLRWRLQVAPGHEQTVRDGHLEYAPIREREDDVEDDVQVFNIGVEDDESYVVEGIVVHNCKHFSKAKGSTPREQKIRGLAWAVVRWAKAVSPRVIAMENVEEFTTWGPLDKKTGMPIKEKRGVTFRAFVRRLERLGYVVEHRLLRACDYGAPTTRRRLFLIARCDGHPIVWPEPTHGPDRMAPHRTAAECIEWDVEVPSIFGRKKNHAEKTLARIARGVRKFVLSAARPFIVPVQTHGGGGNEPRSADEPLRTITASKRGTQAIVVPYLVHRSNGERPVKIDPDGTVHAGQAPRIYDIKQPLGTIMAQGQKHALVAALLLKHNGGHNDECGASGQAVDKPLDSVTSRDSKSLAVARLVRKDEPGAREKAKAVHAFLIRYNGKGEPETLDKPPGTLTSKDRYGLVTVTVDGEDYYLADIGMRMLTSRELFRAQGFADSYDIEATSVRGEPLTKTAQVRCVGNSVAPPIAAAIVRAQFGRAPAQLVLPTSTIIAPAQLAPSPRSPVPPPPAPVKREPEQPQLNRGDMVSFLDDKGKRRKGEVVRIGKRQVTIDAAGWEWGIDRQYVTFIAARQQRRDRRAA